MAASAAAPHTNTHVSIHITHLKSFQHVCAQLKGKWFSATAKDKFRSFSMRISATNTMASG